MKFQLYEKLREILLMADISWMDVQLLRIEKL
jgi:hypothetical protein